MKFNASCKLSKALAKGEGRYVMEHARLDTVSRKLYATDGSMLAVLPVSDLKWDEVGGAVSREALDAALKLPKEAEEAEIVANGSLKVQTRSGELDVPRPDVADREFPRVEAIAEAPRHDDLRVILDARRLALLMQAIGAETVELRFRNPDGFDCWKRSGYNRPVHLVARNDTGAHGAEGWLMPITVE